MPPLAVPYPLINGHRYSFSSIELIINSLPNVVGFSSINYKPSLKASLVYGSRPQPLGRTRGKVEYTFDFEMYRLEFEILKATLGAGPFGYGETQFDTIVQYWELAQPVVTDKILSARIEEVDLSNADGPDASKVKVTCSALGIVLNGASIASIALPVAL